MLMDVHFDIKIGDEELKDLGFIDVFVEIFGLSCKNQ